MPKRRITREINSRASTSKGSEKLKEEIVDVYSTKIFQNLTEKNI